jgi:heat shock protein HtpX
VSDDAAVLDPSTRRRQRVRNLAQSVLLLGCLTAVAAGAMWLLFGRPGLVGVPLVLVVVLVLGPRVSPGMVLAVYRAEPVPYASAPQLHRLLAVLAERAGLSWMPGPYYVPSATPNCFAVGRGRSAAIAVTDGLLRRLTLRELAGVLAHEVGHLRAGDVTVMGLSDAISRLCQMLALVGVISMPLAGVAALRGDGRFLLVALLLAALPLAVALLQLALSRAREFDADLTAAQLTGDPDALATALEVLESCTGRIWERVLVGRGHPLDPMLLRTHPSTDERTRRLRALVPADERCIVGDRPASHPVHRLPAADRPGYPRPRR